MEEKIDMDIVIIRILKDFESKFLKCRELGFENVLDRILKKHLKPLQEQPTYEQGFERGKQVGYKEGWRARGEEPTEEREVEIEKCDICNKKATRLLCDSCYEDIFNY